MRFDFDPAHDGFHLVLLFIVIVWLLSFAWGRYGH